MKQLLVALVILATTSVKAQELFVYTEPASNMATGSIGIRLQQMLLRDKYAQQNTYHLMPELMWGVSKKTMVHASMMFNNEAKKFYATGASAYAKYRFLSTEAVHNHFRMAAFGRYTINNSHIHEYAINLQMHNSGLEGGVVATQLINRLAVSATGSVVHATDNTGGEKFLFGNKLRNAMNYSLSAGILVLPKEYTSYKQVNLNLMAELLGQSNLHNGFNYLDIAPSAQIIINSRMRIDLGYRFAMIKKLQRSATNGALLRLEYNFYNVGK
jgi:hypothetical protein